MTAVPGEPRELCHVCQNFHCRPLCRPGVEYVSYLRRLAVDWYWYLRRKGWQS